MSCEQRAGGISYLQRLGLTSTRDDTAFVRRKAGGRVQRARSKRERVRHVDGRDAQRGHALAMRGSAPVVLPPPLLEDDDFVGECLLLDDGGHVAARDKRRANHGGGGGPDEKHVFELHFLADRARHRRRYDLIRRNDLVLRTENAHHRKRAGLGDRGEQARRNRWQRECRARAQAGRTLERGQHGKTGLRLLLKQCAFECGLRACLPCCSSSLAAAAAAAVGSNTGAVVVGWEQLHGGACDGGGEYSIRYQNIALKPIMGKGGVFKRQSVEGWVSQRGLNEYVDRITVDVTSRFHS
jgi:hypothetical protein